MILFLGDLFFNMEKIYYEKINILISIYFDIKININNLL